jgi:hypothetical protein
MDLLEKRLGMKWLHLSEDIGQQQALANMLMNLQTTQNFRIFKLTVGILGAQEGLYTKELIF